MKLTYPAIFYPCEESSGYTVEVPDLPGCVSEGNSLAEAILMAEDARLRLGARRARGRQPCASLQQAFTDRARNAGRLCQHAGPRYGRLRRKIRR